MSAERPGPTEQELDGMEAELARRSNLGSGLLWPAMVVSVLGGSALGLGLSATGRPWLILVGAAGIAVSQLLLRRVNSMRKQALDAYFAQWVDG